MRRPVNLHVVDVEEIGTVDEYASEDDEQDDGDGDSDAGDVAQVLPTLTLPSLLW